MDTATNNRKYFAVYRDYLFAGIKFGKNPQRFGIHHILVYRNQDNIITCIVIEIITFFSAKSKCAAASGGNALVDVDVDASIGFGFILLIVVYAAMIVAGAVYYHNYTLDKAGLERLKSEGAGLIGKAGDKIKEIKK